MNQLIIGYNFIKYLNIMATEFKGQRFCQECNNMLYAMDEGINDEKVLFYKCKTCDYQERALEDNEFENCVYKTDMEAKAMAVIINDDVVDDPTLQKRNINKCQNPKRACNNKEVVCFNHITVDQFNLIYVCTKCRHLWKQD